MIRSMTAFARQAGPSDQGTLIWELRSVNHRYLEPSFKLPESMRSLETGLREQLRQQLSRGKVECALRIQHDSNHASELHINQALAMELITAGQAIGSSMENPAAIDPLQILQWPGVISASNTDNTAVQQQAMALFQSSLQQLIESREREGAELKIFIEQRLEAIASITEAIRIQLPDILAAQRKKLQDRLSELAAELNPDRLEQEVVMLAQKADVDEELDRLQAHLGEVRRVLTKGQACGRRLDFLMQELNREANTLSSK
jgi:uncharacterized protein (TIGR00255 family)